MNDSVIQTVQVTGIALERSEVEQKGEELCFVAQEQRIKWICIGKPYGKELLEIMFSSVMAIDLYSLSVMDWIALAWVRNSGRVLLCFQTLSQRK